MNTDRPETEKLLSEYTTLAPDYDRRWSGYLRASLSMTMEFVREMPAGQTLDVACGTGQLLAMLAVHREDVQLFGIDRVPAMLEVATQRLGKRVTILEASAEVLPFEPSAFELITCTNALHYFADADAALHEMRRVIAPSGNLVIGDWCRDYLTMKLLNRVLPRTRHAHVHTFSLGEMEQSLVRAGFRIVSSSKKKIDWFWGLLSIHAIPD